MTAIVIILLLVAAAALAMRDSKTLELRREAKERLFALTHGIADVERHIDRICTSGEQHQQSDDGDNDTNNCGCTEDKREEVCKNARVLVGEAKATHAQASVLRVNELTVAQLSALVEEIDAAAIKVTQARRALLKRVPAEHCNEKK